MKRTKEELLDALLLETAIMKYPQGTVYISASLGLEPGERVIESVVNNHIILSKRGDTGQSYIEVKGSLGSLYWNGKWAEIVSLPEGYKSDLDKARDIIYED